MGVKPTFYLRLVKRARRFLRSKTMRRFPLVVKILNPLFEREYWVPTPHRVALGLSIGLFFAFTLLIIPLQMFFAAILCLLTRANLPVALGACWVSNPFSIVPLMFAMVWVGEKSKYLGADFGDHKVDFGIGDMNYAHFIIGCIVSGVIVALVSYPISMAFGTLWSAKKAK